MYAEMIVLRLVHIVGGMFWVGAGIFNTFFLLPALGRAGPAAGAVLAGLQRRRLFTILPVVALLTILSGIRLMQITSANFTAAYFHSSSGRTYAWSGVFAIVGFLIGIVIARPTAIRAGQVGAALAAATNDADRASLSASLETWRRRSSITSLLSLVLVLLAAVGMAVARYVR